MNSELADRLLTEVDDVTTATDASTKTDTTLVINADGSGIVVHAALRPASESTFGAVSARGSGSGSATILAANRERAIAPPTLKDSILIRSSSVAVQSALLAIHLAINAKLLSMLSSDASAVGSLTSPFQTVVLGSATGCLLATGIEIGDSVAENKFEEAGQLAKASWILALGLGIISTGAMISTKWLFPLLTSDQIAATLASDFFLGYAAGAIPGLMVMTTPQISFQAGEWYVPAVAGIAFYIPAAFLSYALAFSAGMGALGVGLGGSITAWVVTACMQVWLTRKFYAPYKLYEMSLPNLKPNLKRLWKTGRQIVLQRLTEWGNIFAITSVVAQDSAALAATTPFVQCSAIIALSMQGLAQASTMLILKNKGTANNLLKANSLNESLSWFKKNRSTLLKNNIAGALVSAAAVGVTYAARESISNFFLSDSADADVRTMAQKFLWLGVIGSIPDSVRIISLGSLRSWKDVVIPTLICSVLMTAIAVPAGYKLSKDEKNWEYMLIFRNIFIMLSALFVAYRCHEKLNNDEASMVRSPAGDAIDINDSSLKRVKASSCSRWSGLSLFGTTKEKAATLLMGVTREELMHEDSSKAILKDDYVAISHSGFSKGTTR